MANHSLYIGGPPSRNYSRAMFPAVPFDGANPEFARIKVAAHKTPAVFDINRTMDFANEAALVNYVSEATFAQADTIDAILLPRRTAILGFLYSIEVAGPAGLVITPSIFSAAGSVALPAIAADEVDNGVDEGWGFAAVGDATWGQVNAELAQMPYFMAQPGTVRLELTTFVPADGFGSLKINLCPVVMKFEGGAW